MLASGQVPAKGELHVRPEVAAGLDLPCVARIAVPTLPIQRRQPHDPCHGGKDSVVASNVVNALPALASGMRAQISTQRCSAPVRALEEFDQAPLNALFSSPATM